MQLRQLRQVMPGMVIALAVASSCGKSLCEPVMKLPRADCKQEVASMENDFLKSKPTKVGRVEEKNPQEVQKVGEAERHSGTRLLKKPTPRLFKPRESIEIVPHH